MKKAIFIGELSLNIMFSRDGRADIGVGDWVVNAALLDGQMEFETIWLGETAASPVGDRLMDALKNAGVETGAIDRFTEGRTPVNISDYSDTSSVVSHVSEPAEAFNPVWPRVDEGDVVVFGSYMALQDRNHAAVLEFVKYARSRKAFVVYLPYFEKHQVTRITRVMPQIFDNLEVADLVIGRGEDLQAIFEDSANAVEVFKKHVLFYCKEYLNLDFKDLEMQYFLPDRSWSLKCHATTNSAFQWYAGALAGCVRALVEGERDPENIMAKANEMAHSEIASQITHTSNK